MIVTLRLRRQMFRVLVLVTVAMVSIALNRFGPASPATVSDGALRAGNPNRPLVALMVNVDWGEEFIPSMLDVLDRKNAKVTFFVVGRWARKNPDLLRNIASRGHEIASHGASHRLCTKLPAQELDELISGGISAIREVLGKEPAPIFAPPSGDCDARVVAAAARYGSRTVLWTLDTVDWKRPPFETIVHRAVDKASPGALVLMHPTKPTLDALPRIIDGLRQKGLEPAVTSKVIEP